MRNSLKQLFRNPVKLFLCAAAVMGSTALCVLGLLLWRQADGQIRSLEESFTTIATVEQTPNTTELSSVWDAALGTYTHSTTAVYDSLLSVDVLENVDFSFVAGPEKRSYYGAHLPEGLATTVNRQAASNYYVVEFTPQETCVPSQPVRVDVVRVLFGKQDGDSLWFCDHFSENPPTLEKGKTYIAGMQYWSNTHGEAISTTVEFVPLLCPNTTQYDSNGNKLESSVIPDRDTLWEEVTEDFYTTGRGEYWLNLVESLQGLDTTIPVLPTDSLSLLPSFHEGKALLLEGGITEQEFQDGAAVCLITEEFARTNGLSVGDSLPLSLYFANYKTPASMLFGYVSSAWDFSLLNSQGQVYSTFFEKEYTIAGIYRYSPDGSESVELGASEMGRDMVIVPANSITVSDEENIADYGPMSATTTSFQIENGSIAACEAALARLPQNAYLTINFDDNGYTQMMDSVSQARSVAAILCGMGFLCLLLVLFLLLYFFVVKQANRMAIERALGRSKSQCRRSILSGLLAVVMISAVLGGIVSLCAAGTIQGGTIQYETHKSFSTKYSVGEETLDERNLLPQANDAGNYPVAAGVVSVVLVITIAAGNLLVDRGLKRELIVLLNHRE